MNIDTPSAQHIPQLRSLWKQAFGDPDGFLDGFFSTGFTPSRCRCLFADQQPAAVVYWFDCCWADTRLAYLYAIATEDGFQGRGFCRALLDDTHKHLQEAGYAGSILVPGNKDLFRLYEKLGYRTCSHVREFSCAAGNTPVALRPIDTAEYAALRRQYLPTGSVLQEGPTLAFLQTFSQFYTGENILLAATLEADKLVCHELLGPPEAASGILTALSIAQGRFRTPGKDKPFAMYHSLTADTHMPDYLGLALD